MDEIKKMHKFYELKDVYRASETKTRQESSAEHSWSCLILADYIITKNDLKLDKIKVYELLMYHDVVEIESGDTPLHERENRKNKKELEKEASKILSKKLPKELKQKYLGLFEEFEEQKTKEAKFAKAIDRMDAIFQSLFDKPIWAKHKYTELLLRSLKEKYFLDFPYMKDMFEKIVKYLRENDYFYKD